MAKFLDQDGTSYLVQSLISKTKTLNGQNIWNLDPNTQLHRPGNLNTSQLAIFPLTTAILPYRENQYEQIESRFVAWANSESMFQIDTPTIFPNTNLGSLRWLIMNYLAMTSSATYSPNYVMFAFQLIEMGAYLTGSASSFIYKYLLVDKIFTSGANIVLSGRVSDLAASPNDIDTELSNGRFYVSLATSGSGDSYTCTGATWQYVKDNIYEPFSLHKYELDATSTSGSTSESNPLMTLDLEHPFNSIQISLPQGQMSLINDKFLANICIGNDSLANVKILVEFVSGSDVGTSGVSHIVFSNSTNTTLRKPIRFSSGNATRSTDPNIVLGIGSGVSYNVTATDQSYQRSMYRHIEIICPQAGQRFLIDAYRTNNNWYAGYVIPLNSRLALSAGVSVTS